MGDKKQRKKKKKQKVLLKQKTVESEKFSELLGVLEELEKEEKYVDIQICPRCKSPRVRRVRSTSGDMSGHMGLLPVKFDHPTALAICRKRGLAIFPLGSNHI